MKKWQINRSWQPSFDFQKEKIIKNQAKWQLSVAFLGAFIFAPNIARADLFGGDVAVLTQILAEEVQEYYELKSMLQTSTDQLDLLREINSGIDNSIALVRTLPIKDENVLAEVTKFKIAIQRVQDLYGMIPQSPEQGVETIHDQTVAESIKMANDFKGYSEMQEKNSDVIAAQARLASPKGAERMQATTSAEILRSLSQLLRLNTQLLKLQSEQLAMNNKHSKDGVANFQRVNSDLGHGFSNLNMDMNLTRF